MEQIGHMRQLLQLDLINNPVSKLAGYREKMFSIFPTITILDTLDKGGKDAYSGSSMALTISRVPDTLFDKSPSVPAPTFAPIVAPRAPIPAARTASKASVVAPVAPVAATVSPAVRSALRLSASKPDTKSASISKKGKLGKSGKLGKTVLASKSRSASARAGLSFPVARLKRRLK